MRQVALIGTGLIGGSIGLALRREGLDVARLRPRPGRADASLRLGVVDEVARSIDDAVAGADVVVVAVPVGPGRGRRRSPRSTPARALVTDVGSVKGRSSSGGRTARPDAAPRFVGGHPMAGSEQDGLDGADADLFVGATWVLTPTERTDPDAFQTVRGLVRSLGAEVVAVTPEHHDALVAVVSHVPQLAATTLMDVAARHGEEHAHAAAARGRRLPRHDPHRRERTPASGRTSAWRTATRSSRALDAYLGALQQVRTLLVDADDARLLALLERARLARRNLPVGIPAAEELVELRVPVPDRPGVLAEVTTLAGRLGVNIVDVEIAHSLEGGGGVLVLVVPAASADAFEAGLAELGYHHSRSALS